MRHANGGGLDRRWHVSHDWWGLPIKESAMSNDSHMFVASHTGERIYGRRLSAGETLRATDMFESPLFGHWDNCPLPGTAVPADTNVVWVRPGVVAL